ncbi:FliM/FliN family flagellar motor switch protein [uncultured Hoeflea sp.]|uniref:FliM/FliN family flagellar motor switch protein n=1 Tax=uncultured Hoeflea sp. TaxID=538666 RepID=UPI0026145831|nr:FliM/FliN family flagellar motor switch protein [uncultured Hoeflea sp.]
MAGENATDDDLEPGPLDDSAIDEAVGDLRGVLKKDAGDEPVLDNESVDGMGGAAAFGSDFGADIGEGGDAAGTDDPFNIGDAPAAGGLDMSEFGDGGLDMPGAPDLGAPDLGAPGLDSPGLGAPEPAAAGLGSDFGGGADFGAQANAAAQQLGATGENTRVDLVLGIPIDVQIILGSSRMAVSSLMDLAEGATIALDRKIGEPVEIMVNGKMIGRGEITVHETDESRFAVRIIEVIGAPQKKTD